MTAHLTIVPKPVRYDALTTVHGHEYAKITDATESEVSEWSDAGYYELMKRFPNLERTIRLTEPGVQVQEYTLDGNPNVIATTIVEVRK